MTVGAASGTANSWMNVLRGTTYTGAAGLFVQLHTGDPGAAGTANVSAVTTRNALTWAAASGGACTLSALASYAMTTTETITHLTLWTASSGGTFLASGQLTAPKPVNNGDTLTFNTLTGAITPIAA